jgi:nitrite reductase/ring-hydroxylating ferredoxin subunit
MVAAHGRSVICLSRELVERGLGVRFTVSRRGEAVPAFAVRFCGKVYAYLNRCAHRSLELDWIQGDFFDAFGEHIICATHGARYAPTSGACIGGATPFRGEAPSKGVRRDATSGDVH